MICQGSSHSLTTKSIKAISIVHSIPWYLKLAISGFFNFCNLALHWASCIYTPPSKAEMMIACTELTLSVLASWLIWKRFVSENRWVAVGITSMGLVLIGFSLLMDTDDKDEIDVANKYRHTTGNLLILGQLVMYALQDISNEIIFCRSLISPQRSSWGWKVPTGCSFLWVCIYW